jgi:formylglycine-generating enzyme required for sulfatase activity
MATGGSREGALSRRRFITTAAAVLWRPQGGVADIVTIPAGSFWMGSDPERLAARYPALSRRLLELLQVETPRRRVTLPAFEMDRYEVTNRQFRDFLRERPEWRPDRLDRSRHNGQYLADWSGGECPRGRDDHPVVFVTWQAAVAFARWRGKRLPTEAEWEYGARGGLTDAEYPWGNEEPTPSRANYGASGVGEAVKAGSYPANRYGLHDMAGNVWEYCLDEWRERSGTLDGRAAALADPEAVVTRRVIRGGSWGGAPLNLRVAYRDSHPPDAAGAHVGFRCARDRLH